MIREDRELLAELARLNTDLSTLALRIMEGSASAREQTHYSDRLMAAGERLRRRAEVMGGTVIEGDVVEGRLHWRLDHAGTSCPTHPPVGDPPSQPIHSAERLGPFALR